MKDTTISLGQHGQVRGRQDDHGVCRFLGIPYALPPLGPRRWTKPGALPADHVYQDGDHQPRDCTMFGPVCAQEIYYVDGKAINELPAAVRHSEDCLNLNIWTPADPTSADGAWPVLVFIHGGWLQIGSPSVLDRDQPQELIGADGAGLQAVVVSIGYRLNVFGFLAGDGVPGNFGFWDQREALHWIQKHIRHFGGDPGRVTLFGHSAGGFSAHAQLQYELLHTDGAQPLFQSVFLASNAIPAQPKTPAEASHQFDHLCSVLGISPVLSVSQRIDALRALSAEQLVAALSWMNMSNFRAVTDDDLIRPDMVARFQDGTFARAFAARGYSLMVGETETEHYLYSRWLPPHSDADLPVKLQNYYAAAVVDKLLTHAGYAAAADTDAAARFGHMVADMQVRAPVRVLCRQLRVAGVPATRVLRYRVAFRPAFFADMYPADAGVTHGADMFVWWGTRRLGFSDEEWAKVQAWLGVTLARLVRGEGFATGATDDVESYLLLGPKGEMSPVKDQYWRHLMSVMEAVSWVEERGGP